MKNILINLMFLGLLPTLSYSQLSLPESQSTHSAMGGKTYEATATQATDHLLAYVNTDVVTRKKPGVNRLEKRDNQSAQSQKASLSQFSQIHYPNSKSIIFVKPDSQKPKLSLMLSRQQNGTQDGAIGKGFHIGHTNQQQMDPYLNQVDLSFSKNRSMANSPGYVPILRYGINIE